MRLFSQSTACALIALVNVTTAFHIGHGYEGNMVCQHIEDCAHTFWNGYEEKCRTTTICTQPCPSDNRFRCIETCTDDTVTCKGSAENPDCKIQRKCEETYEEMYY